MTDEVVVPPEKKDETPPVKEGYDAFSNVFDEITAPTMDDKKKDEVTPPAKTAEEIAAEVVVAAKKDEVTPPVKTAEEIAAEVAAAAKKTETPPAKTAEEIAAEAAAVAAAAAKKDEVTPPAPAKTAEETAAEEAADKPVWYKPKDEEVASVQKYESEWPDISVAEAIRTKAAIHNAVTYVFHEIKKTYQPTLDRFSELSAAMEHELTLGALRRAHPDYDTVIGEVEKWADTLPAAYKAGAKDVLEQGTPEEVAGLVADYKKVKTPPVAPPAPKAPPTPISDAAKKAAEKLKPMDSKRTSAATAPDPNSFEDAWADAVKEG